MRMSENIHEHEQDFYSTMSNSPTIHQLFSQMVKQYRRQYVNPRHQTK